MKNAEIQLQTKIKELLNLFQYKTFERELTLLLMAINSCKLLTLLLL